MKPTDKQKELVDKIIVVLNSFGNTNDISSPTHHSNITDYLDRIEEDKLVDLTGRLMFQDAIFTILTLIRRC